MTTKNDVTGDSIKSKVNSQQYRDNWEKIFSEVKEDDSDEKNEGARGSTKEN